MAPEGRKCRLAKAAGAEPSGKIRDEKLHADVKRSTFGSQNVQNTPGSDQFWKLRCRKSARRCGAKHIWKSKVEKKGSEHFWTFGCGFCVAGTRDSAPCQKWAKSQGFVSVQELHYTPLHYNYSYNYDYNYNYNCNCNYNHTTLHYTTPIALHYTTLHSTPPRDKHSYNYSYNCITLHHTTLITLHYGAPYTTPHSTSLHYTTLNYTTVHYNYNYNYATLHQTTLHYPTLHCTSFTTPPQMQLQVHYTNYTTPQLQLDHITTTTAALHHTTSSSCGWGDRPSDHCNHCNHSKIDSSNHLSVHKWIRSAICDSQQPSSHIGFLFWNFRHCLVRYYWYASQWMTCMAITYDQVGSLGNVEATFNAS